MATSDVVLDVIPQTGGKLAMPGIKLMKYVEKDEKSPELHTKEDEGEEVNASESRPSHQSPLVLPFACGQVYNKTMAVRVCVLPSANPDLAWIWDEIIPLKKFMDKAQQGNNDIEKPERQVVRLRSLPVIINLSFLWKSR